MQYQLKVCSNAYHMDEEEAHISGHFSTFKQALSTAKDIVIRFIQEDNK